jgi:hypothetical protein
MKLLLPGLCASIVLFAACTGHGTDSLRPTPVHEDASGSVLTSGGFSFTINTSYADTARLRAPLLRPEIIARATIRNDRAGLATISFGACNVSLDAYDTPARGGTPVWRSSRSEPWEGTYGRACILPLYTVRLVPGAEASLGSYSTRVIEILGDSLPDGHYYFTATIGVGGDARGLSLPAGDFELALPRPPLPDSVTHDLVTYEARATVGTGTDAAVQAAVTATLTHAGAKLVRLPRECIVSLVVYRSRERRDAAPRSGAPDWRQSRGCAEGTQEIRMNRGESVTFETVATAREIVGAPLPDGEYHFAIIVHTPTRDLWMSAGSGVLRR